MRNIHFYFLRKLNENYEYKKVGYRIQCTFGDLDIGLALCYLPVIHSTSTFQIRFKPPKFSNNVHGGLDFDLRIALQNPWLDFYIVFFPKLKHDHIPF